MGGCRTSHHSHFFSSVMVQRFLNPPSPNPLRLRMIYTNLSCFKGVCKRNGVYSTVYRIPRATATVPPGIGPGSSCTATTICSTATRRNYLRSGSRCDLRLSVPIYLYLAQIWCRILVLSHFRWQKIRLRLPLEWLLLDVYRYGFEADQYVYLLLNILKRRKVQDPAPFFIYSRHL